MVRDMIRMTADLGAKVFRIYLAWTGATRAAGGGARYDIAQKMWDTAHEDFKEDEYWAWCRECLSESARYAADYDVPSRCRTTDRSLISTRTCSA